MASRDLISDDNLAFLGDIDFYDPFDANGKSVTRVVFRDLLHVNNDTVLSGRHLVGRILVITGLVMEQSEVNPYLRRLLLFSAWRDLAHKNILSLDVRSDLNHATLVQMAREFLGDVGWVAGDLLFAELCRPHLNLVFFDVNGRKTIVAYETLTDDNTVLIVISSPWDIGNQEVLAQGKFPFRRRIPVCEKIADVYFISCGNGWVLVDTRVLVRPLELLKLEHTSPGYGNVGHAVLRHQNQIVAGQLSPDGQLLDLGLAKLNVLSKCLAGKRSVDSEELIACRLGRIIRQNAGVLVFGKEIAKTLLGDRAADIETQVQHRCHPQNSMAENLLPNGRHVKQL